MLRCREIADADVPALAALLARGFPKRSREFWLKAFEQLSRRAPPPSFVKYGYLMGHNDVPVGVLLVIGATVNSVTRCNHSSWYVDPQFSALASLLALKARQGKDVTHLNVTPADDTFPIIEAQGFTRYSDGVFMSVPMLSRAPSGPPPVIVVEATDCPEIACDAAERTLLFDHAFFGCMSIWCVAADGAHPFVFRFRFVEHVIPSWQLIYCRDVADFVRFAKPLGRYLMRRGGPFVMVDANGPMPGLVGKFFKNKMPKYFKGPKRPQLGDLAYTEIAILGV